MRTVSVVFLANVAGATLGKQADCVVCETDGTQAKLGSRSLLKYRLAQLSFEENHHVLWEEAKILETEKNSVYGKYKEVAYVACLQDPISQPTVKISLMWHPSSGMNCLRNVF